MYRRYTTEHGPIQAYKKLITANKLKPNNHQLETAKLLQELHEKLLNYKPNITLNKIKQHQKKQNQDDLKSPDFKWIEDEGNFITKLQNMFKRKEKSKKIDGPIGLYLHGNVGTGKSMIMDLFYENMPIKEKRRVHFHQFMQDVHSRVHQLRTQYGITYDPIPLIAQDLAKDAWLLCFDEFQVTDIADAMLLKRLCSELFNNGVVMVATSNRHPDELYKNGIQRESFLPTIDLLKQKCNVHSLDSGVDFRTIEQERLQVYFDSNDPNSDLQLENIFKKLITTKVEQKVLEFWGRQMSITSSGRVAIATFHQLCSEPHSAADYLELAKHFDVVIIKNIPQMNMSHRSEARRFITLIDALYDHKVRLIASFESSLKELFSGKEGQVSFQQADRLLFDDLKLDTKQLNSPMFTGNEEVFAFQRAVSRLIEMQGVNWIGEHYTNLLKNKK
ncbi:Lactation elevated protein 1 [Boothiomyces sp. JEL0838]|nr:Lactation elevated protein 1 [Boothiomyces sp. JEL0838]